MFLRRLLRSALIFLFLVSTGILAWGVWKSPAQVEVLHLPQTESILTATGRQEYSLPQPYQLKLAWRSTQHRLDEQVMTLSMLPATGQGSSPITEASAAYTTLAEARLDLAGIPVQPDNLVSQALPAGQRLHFTWRIQPAADGVYPGKIVLYLRFLPLDGSPPDEAPVLARPIEIRVTSLAGFSGPAARWMGSLGMLASAALLVWSIVGSKKRLYA